MENIQKFIKWAKAERLKAYKLRMNGKPVDYDYNTGKWSAYNHVVLMAELHLKPGNKNRNIK